MSRLFPLMILALTVFSCARLPDIRPVGPKEAERIGRKCAAPYLASGWQFVHAIETRMNGRRGTLVGVTVLFPETRTIRCALTSPEGLTLLSARDEDGRVTIDRAIPPFDSPDFVRGMLADIKLIYLRPDGPIEAVGTAETGAARCRYRIDSHEIQDVEISPDGGWTLCRYNGNRLIRTVQADPPTRNLADGSALPQRLTLNAAGPQTYTLRLTLLEAADLDAPPNPKEKTAP